MNRGQDVVTESEEPKIEQRLNESEEERTILRQEINELKLQLCTKFVSFFRRRSYPSLIDKHQLDNGNANEKVAPFPSGLFSAQILPP
jgi:hypothetical protein